MPTGTPLTSLGTVAGFGGETVTVIVVAGTLAQARRRTHTTSHRPLIWPALRPAVVAVEVPA